MAGFAEVLAPMQPPKTGFADVLAAAFGAGPDKMGAYQKGIDAGSQVGLRSAQTEGALARAETDRAERIQKELVNDVYRKAQATPGYAGSLADMLVTGRDPQQYGLDPLSVQEHDFRAGIADPGTSWEQLQRNRMALGDAPAQRFDPLGAGRGVQDLMAGTLNPTMQPIDTATVDAERALETQRLRPPAVASTATKLPSGYRYTADGNLEFIPGGPQDPSRPAAAPAGKLPAKVRQAVAENNSLLANIDAAIAIVEQNPESFGLKYSLGDTVNQRIDPNGVAARAAVGNIGSAKIHERTGAAMSAKEYPRLTPFIPAVTDQAAAIVTKLQQMRDTIRQEQDAIQAGYTAAPGGATPMQGAEPSPKTQAEYDALPPGTVYIDTDGKRKRKR